MSVSEVHVHQILRGRVRGKDALDALDITIKALQSGSCAVFSTETLVLLIEGVANSRNPRRIDRDVANGVENVCRILGGRLSGSDKNRMWQKVLGGGFIEASSAFV